MDDEGEMIMGEAADWHRDAVEAEEDARQMAEPDSRPQVVQIRIPGARRSYAYAWWGSPALTEGQWVVLPGNVVNEDGGEGYVTGFGRDGYKGPLKEITELKETQDGWQARMRATRTKQDAGRVWRAAQRSGLDSAALKELERIGNEALAAAELKREQEAERWE